MKNSLRIGNIVEYSDQFGVYFSIIRSLGEQTCQVEDHGAFFEYEGGVRPVEISIPYASEILGFNKITDGDPYFYYLTLESPKILDEDGDEYKLVISISKSGESPTYIGLINNTTDEIAFSTKVQYLHDIQNIYFALAGKELPIEL